MLFYLFFIFYAMRFSLKLTNRYPENICILPIDYQYYLSSAIYKILNSGDKTFADFLHKTGYVFEKKNFKFFTFSSVRIKSNTIKDRLILADKYLYFSVSFYVPQIQEIFVRGLFSNREIIIGDKFTKAFFKVKSINREDEPEFTETMDYYCLSPVLVAQKHEGEKQEQYLSPNDEGYANIFFKNLQDKYHAYTNYENKPKQRFDLSKCSLKVVSKPNEKLITIKKYTKEETQLKAWEYKMRITAPIELQKAAYYAGVGKSNAMGFGCLRVNKE